jgi:hypothetical protein
MTRRKLPIAILVTASSKGGGRATRKVTFSP